MLIAKSNNCWEAVTRLFCGQRPNKMLQYPGRLSGVGMQYSGFGRSPIKQVLISNRKNIQIAPDCSHDYAVYAVSDEIFMAQCDYGKQFTGSAAAKSRYNP
jgi:hypothetical protein